MKLAIEGEQVKTDEPPIQAEVEARLAELEPDVEVLAADVLGGGRARILRIFLDRPGGVDLDLCARVTTHLRDLLRDYTVEVSSPGPERPLTKLEHYRRFGENAADRCPDARLARKRA